MNLETNKVWATKQNYGLIDPMIKNLYPHIDFDTIKTVYDIGSRDALQSLELSTVFPRASIFAFEANPKAIETCCDNAKKRRNITIIPMAVSNVDGEVCFFPQDQAKSRDVNIGVSSMLKLMDETPCGWHWVQKEIKVQSTTLNAFVKRGNPPPDLIWIDIQGAELLAFKGASDILGNVKAIFTEAGKRAYYHEHGMAQDIDAYLCQFGFRKILEVPGHAWESDFLYIK